MQNTLRDIQNAQRAPGTRARSTRAAMGITGFFLALSLASTLFIARDMEHGLAMPLLFVTLVNINIILAVILLLLLSRNLIKFFFEKRTPGPSFKNKLVWAFIGISLVPCILLFGVASGLLTSSIESGLSVQVEKSLSASLTVAQDYYGHLRQTTRDYAQQVQKELRDNHFFAQCASCLRDFLHAKKLDDTELHLIRLDQNQIVSTQEPPPDDLGTEMSAAPPSGQSRHTLKTGDEIVRVALTLEEASSVPMKLVVDRRIPAAFTEHAATIQHEFEEYQQLARFKRPIEGSYILSFFILVLLIIFAATWFGIYLARRITVPIENLAHGTTAIAQGNLDFQIDLTSNDELGVLVRSFNQMTRDLKQSREALVRAQKIATWQEVAQQMAHEIKNPLTPIQLATERLRKKYAERSPEFDQIFDASTGVIIQEVQQLVTLVNEFSKFARFPPIHRTPQELLPIVQEVVALYQSGHKDIRFHVHADAVLPQLQLDRDPIKRLLVNLFENAVEAIADALSRHANVSPPVSPAFVGEISVSLSCDHSRSHVLMSVSDNGIGIAPEDRDHIFLPHFSRKKRGTGFGLALAHRIMVDHEGHLTVAPRIPQGTTFTLTFPRHGEI